MKTELHVVGNIIAESAETLVRQLVADPGLKSIVTNRDAEVAIDAIVRQDPAPYSKRMWAAALAVVTAVMAAMLGEWMPAASATVTAAFALWSKIADQRPER